MTFMEYWRRTKAYKFCGLIFPLGLIIVGIILCTIGDDLLRIIIGIIVLAIIYGLWFIVAVISHFISYHKYQKGNIDINIFKRNKRGVCRFFNTVGCFLTFLLLLGTIKIFLF